MKANAVKNRAVSKKPYYELFKNLLLDFLSVRLRLRIFRPLMTNIYITKRCNLRCLYCYPPGDEPDLPLGLGLQLLEKIRPGCPAINFTGGEPSLHPHLRSFLEKARELRFRPIVVSTNAYEIENLLELLPLIDNVIVSLDSMDESTNDDLCGVPGSTQAIIANIERLAKLRKQFGFNVSIHAVLCPTNLDHIEDLVTFCDSLCITLSVSPQHVGAHPREELRNNTHYESAIRKLRQLKREGRSVACSMSYLNKIERFSDHRCFPFFSPRVEPDGTVYFPCYCIRNTAHNLMDYPNLYSLMKEKGEWMDKYLDCRRRCFLACYMEVERYVRNPLCVLREVPFRTLTLGRKITLAEEERQYALEQKDG
ncbi:MAG: radical SAM protein [Candidatus Zixiibacteriota bacterium]|nr:MAG: radical SAM protein [candidate division Zixibacteria bacterium]